LGRHALKLEQYQKWLMLLCEPEKRNLHTISTACTACLYLAMLTCPGGVHDILWRPLAPAPKSGTTDEPGASDTKVRKCRA
jgi:hypothetical protein